MQPLCGAEKGWRVHILTEVAKIQAKDTTSRSGFVAREGRAEPLVQALPNAPNNGLAPSLTRRRLQVFLAMMVVDVAILLGSFAVIGFTYLIVVRGQFAMNTAMLSAYLLLPIFLTICLFNGTYSGTALVDWKRATWRVIQGLVISALLLNFFAFFAKMNAEFSRVAFALSVVTAFLVMGLARGALVMLAPRIWGRSPINRLLIKAGGPDIGMSEVYTVDAREHGLVPTLDDPASLNRLAKYLLNMDEVLVSCSESERAAWSQVLKGAGVHSEIVSTMARDIGALGIRHYPSRDFSTLLISTGALRVRDRVLKRLFDLAVSIAALAVLSPVMLLVALAIKLQDGGPVFFRQRRVGRGNHFFNIYKFRSMSVEKADADGGRSATKDDDRVTSLGGFIRRTSIDELPQLFNVVRGDMSMVGPRPHALGSQAGEKLFWEVDLRYWQRHILRPGITGLAQIRGYRGATDNEVDLANRLHSDLEYLRDWSLLRDIAIIISTMRVLRHDRAF